MHRRSTPFMLLAGLVALIVAAGVIWWPAGTTTTGPDASAPPVAVPDGVEAAPDPPAPAEQAQRSGPPDPGVALAVRTEARLGPVVVDGDGFTLYRFDGDASGAAGCIDACASTWPPATIASTAKVPAEGIDAGSIGILRRRDGARQLTVHGWPVYRFAGDTRPGMHAGHGLGQLWFAITPAGGRAGQP